MIKKKIAFPRRTFLAGTASLVGSLVSAQETGLIGSVEIEPVVTKKTRRNISSFRVLCLLYTSDAADE